MPMIPRILSVLNTTPERWIELARQIPPELFAMPAAPGEWSAIECLRHMVDTESVFQARLAAFRAGRDFAGFDPDEQEAPLEYPTARELAAEFARLRGLSLRLLENITQEDFKLTARHAELGQVTLGQMLNEWAAHDLNHTVQAERAMMQPFLKACGPWQKYFTDHLIGG